MVSVGLGKLRKQGQQLQRASEFSGEQNLNGIQPERPSSSQGTPPLSQPPRTGSVTSHRHRQVEIALEAHASDNLIAVTTLVTVLPSLVTTSDKYELTTFTDFTSTFGKSRAKNATSNDEDRR